MEILDNNIKYHIELRTSTVIEFIQTMFFIGSKDELVKLGNEVQFFHDGKFLEIVDKIERKLSRFITQELEYFFNTDDFGYYCALNYIVENPDVKEINELIKNIEKTDIDTFIYYITKSLVGEYVTKDKSKALYKEKKYCEIIDIIDKNIEQDLSIKEKLLESLKNPVETKQRFCLLLKQFYLKSYKLFEDEIISIVKPEGEKYEKLFLDNPKSFFIQYIKNDLSFYTPEKIYLFSSFMKLAGSTSVIRDEQHISIIVMGTKNDEFYGRKAIKERIQKFFKILCDKKRLDIIDLLGERPHYVQEMAEKLSLTSATISYHMNFLYSFDLVCSERDEHRVYYSLNKDKAKEMFDEAVRTLLHEY